MKSFDFENANNWKTTNEEVLLTESERFEFIETELKELKNWKENNVYEKVED